MSHLLSVQQISKYFSNKHIFSNLTFSIHRGDRLAIVGKNGIGKSTLLRLLNGDLEVDEGKIIKRSRLTIGYLSQEVSADYSSAQTVKEYLQEQVGNLKALEIAMEACAEKLSSKATPEIIERYGELQAEYERRGGYTIDHRFDQVMNQLHLKSIDQHRMVRTLSGGERVRLALAVLILNQPDVLLLDEPTNHIDARGVEWLEEYFQSYPHAIVVVSHDRKFLDKAVNAIAEISYSKDALIRYTGNYSDYLTEKEKEWARSLRAYEGYHEEVCDLKKIIKTYTYSKKSVGSMRDNNKMAYDKRGEKQQRSESRILKQARKKLQELEQQPVLLPKKPHLQISFNSQSLNSEQRLEIVDLDIEIDRKILLTDLNASFKNGDRVCVTGINGVGKSTLLKTLYKAIKGQNKPLQGEVNTTPSPKVGILYQHAPFEDQDFVLEAFGGSESALMKLGFFEHSILKMRVGTLSEGQKQKLQIAKLINSQATILLLDEPTNHLDINSLNALEEALRSFPGIVIAVSHDRWFVEAVSTQVWNLSRKK